MGTVLGRLGAGDGLSFRSDGDSLLFRGGRVLVADPTFNVLRAVEPGSRRTSVVVGNGNGTWSGEATLAKAQVSPRLVAGATGGGLLLADGSAVRLVRARRVTTLAGGGPTPRVDGAPAVGADLATVTGLVADPRGGFWFSQPFDHQVWHADASGRLALVAGNGTRGSVGDGLPARAAALDFPAALALGPDRALYVSDLFAHRVRRIDPVLGTISTAAGNGSDDRSDPRAGDGGPAAAAPVPFPDALVVRAGRLYVVSSGAVRTVDLRSGLLGTAFTGSFAGLTFGPDGSAYTVRVPGGVVRRFPSGRTVALTAGYSGPDGDGGPAALAQVAAPRDVAATADGQLFVSDVGTTGLRHVGRDGRVSTVGQYFSSFDPFTFDPDDPRVRPDLVLDAGPVVVQRDGRVLVASVLDGTVHELDARGRPLRVVGDGTPCAGASARPGNGGPADRAQLCDPLGLALDRAGRLYVADTGNQQVRRVTGGRITAVAGDGQQGFSGDGGPATAARLNDPHGVAVGPDGAVLIADTLNFRVRRVDPRTGRISTVAGTGRRGTAGEGGPARQAQLGVLVDIGVDGKGRVFLLEADGRVLTLVSGRLVRLAGAQRSAWNGDGPAGRTLFGNPSGLAVDPAGRRLWVADNGNHRVRAIDLDR